MTLSLGATILLVHSKLTFEYFGKFGLLMKPEEFVISYGIEESQIL